MVFAPIGDGTVVVSLMADGVPTILSFVFAGGCIVTSYETPVEAPTGADR